MNVFSWEFGLIFFAAILILSSRMKKSRPSIIKDKKRFTIDAQRLKSPLSKETPLVCLLDDNRYFGRSHREQEPPELPHVDGCGCEVHEILTNTDNLFEGKDREQETWNTDLGDLKGPEKRYYHFRLIASHQSATEAQKAEYSELAENISIREEFKQKVDKHLKPEEKSA